MADCIEIKKNYNKRAVKKAEKMGTVIGGTVETTPFEYGGKLYYFCWNRKYTNEKNPHTTGGNYRICEFETGKTVSDFAYGHSFGCIYTENGKFYCIGTTEAFGSGKLDLFVSDDMVNWEEKEIFNNPEWHFYNTSVCKGKDGYIMAVEISHPVAVAGENPYTIVFMQSKDLYNWEFLDTERHIYVKDRYTACPVIRYEGGYYYMIYLEEMPGYNFVPYIARTKDLENWEMAPRNPIMFYGDDDRKIIHPERFTPEEIKCIETSLDTNNSDVDLCEYGGKTYIFYSWGNQLGTEFLAYSVFDGCMLEYFESFF